ncbi:hypothetical protein M231_04613 [Tremella mesenterica]|uniref:Uncharacterized protein n=1 Tax=Tremella mesenterica TaxID=5217 RepID=A0A4Q1BKM8_TREME|nr:hypothetical protein M231_04613 [Tremella mesenterica]
MPPKSDMRSGNPPSYSDSGLDDSPPPYIRKTRRNKGSDHECGLSPSSPTHKSRWDGISALSANQGRSDLRAGLTLRVMNMRDSDSDTQSGSSVENRLRYRTEAMDTSPPLSLEIKTNQGYFSSKLANGSDNDTCPSSPETMYNTPTSDDELADDESPSSLSQKISLAPGSCSNAPWVSNLAQTPRNLLYAPPSTHRWPSPGR